MDAAGASRVVTGTRWAVLGVCTLGTALAYVHRLGLAPLLPAVIGDLGVSDTAAGVLVTAYFWTYIAVQLPVGVLTDGVGARRTMLASLGVLLLGVLVFPLAGSLAAAIAARGLVGLGAAGLWLPSLRLIREWFPAGECGRAVGLCSAGGGVGGTAALVLLPALAETLGWRSAYAVTAGPVLAMLALTLWLIRPGPLAGDGGPPGGGRAGSGLGEVLAHRALWPLALASLASYAGFVALVSWLPALLVREAGVTAGTAGVITSLLTVGTMLSWPLGGYLSDRLGRRRGVYLVSLALGAGAGGGLAASVAAAGVAASAALALATGLALGGMVTPFYVAAAVFPARLTGTVAGVVNTFWLLGGVVGPALVGRVLDLTGSAALGLGTCAALLVLALGAAAGIREPEPRGPGTGRGLSASACARPSGKRQ